MMHVTEEEMIEQVYGESDNTAVVQRHLDSCRECARNFAELKRDLAEVEHIEAPPRDVRYGERVWATLAPLLPMYAESKSRWWPQWLKTPLLVRGLSYAVAAALLVSCGFYAGRMWKPQQASVVAHNEPPMPAQQPKQPIQKQPIVVVVLDDHLDRSERFLVELKHADFDATTASPMRDEAQSLLAANRICRKNAAQADDPELTTALDHLDSLLADAANQPGGLNAATIARLQDKINSDGVLFEVRVLRSRITHRAASSPVNNPVKGDSI